MTPMTARRPQDVDRKLHRYRGGFVLLRTRDGRRIAGYVYSRDDGDVVVSTRPGDAGSREVLRLADLDDVELVRPPRDTLL